METVVEKPFFLRYCVCRSINLLIATRCCSMLKKLICSHCMLLEMLVKGRYRWMSQWMYKHSECRMVSTWSSGSLKNGRKCYCCSASLFSPCSRARVDRARSPWVVQQRAQICIISKRL